MCCLAIRSRRRKKCPRKQISCEGSQPVARPRLRVARGYGRCSMGTCTTWRRRATTKASGGIATSMLALAEVAEATQPKGVPELAEVHRPSPPASSRGSAYDIHYAVIAATPQSAGRARCASNARRDLCRGAGEILLPTATKVRGSKRLRPFGNDHIGCGVQRMPNTTGCFDAG